MFDINGTFVVFLISFLIFMVLLNAILIKPVASVIEARAAKIKGDLEAGKAARETSEELLRNYEERLHSIRTQAQAVINEAVSAASKVRDQEMSRIAAEGQAKLEKAKEEIRTEKTRLIEDLVKQESELVQTIVSKLLDEPAKITLEPALVRKALEEAC